jgi:hypothetical protein
MDYLAGEILALIKAHPDWVALVIAMGRSGNLLFS